jgi:hypothetical protein
LAGTITDPPFTGDTANETLLHVTVLKGLITGVGLTYTVNVNEEKVVPQFGILGTTV